WLRAQRQLSEREGGRDGIRRRPAHVGRGRVTRASRHAKANIREALARAAGHWGQRPHRGRRGSRWNLRRQYFPRSGDQHRNAKTSARIRHWWGQRGRLDAGGGARDLQGRKGGKAAGDRSWRNRKGDGYHSVRDRRSIAGCGRHRGNAAAAPRGKTRGQPWPLVQRQRSDIAGATARVAVVGELI